MNIKKITAILLGLTLVLSAACTSKPADISTSTNNNVQSEDTNNENNDVENRADNGTENSETKVIVDNTGTEIELPAKIERVVISAIFPLPSVYCMYKGSTEGLVGMHPASMSAAKNSFLPRVFPDVVNVDTSFVQDNKVNVEQLLSLKPDVVFYSAANKEEKELYENAGIKAVAFSPSLANFNTIETYSKWIELLEQIFGEQSKAGELVAYGKDVENRIIEEVAEVKDKPKVMVLFNYGDGKMMTSGSKFFGQYLIETAGGINVASDLEGMAPINMEQVYEWNPDIILITNFTTVMPSDLIDNKIDGDDWSKVAAVKNKKVYKFPLGMYRWFPASSDAPLALMWVAKNVQPELFKDIDLDKEIKSYYEKYYNITLTDEDVQSIYNPSKDAAKNK